MGSSVSLTKHRAERAERARKQLATATARHQDKSRTEKRNMPDKDQHRGLMIDDRSTLKPRRAQQAYADRLGM